MYFINNKLFYINSDMRFVERFGLVKATQIVLNHYNTYDFPFIYDTYQLADVLGVSCKELFKVSKNCNKLYTAIHLKKKSGGTRTVYSPQPALKRLQKTLLRTILSKHTASEFATAYVRSSRIKDNALPHVNHKYLLKMDVTDFFGSITYLQVISSAFPSKIYPKHIGAILTSLCCKDEVLPQGAPTSPALSNIVMKRFDDILGNWCKKRDITYTRYCDDLTFSSDHPLDCAFQKAYSMLEKWGFRVNEKKTHFITNANRQTVTGLTVNQKVSVPADYKRELRQELHYAIKFGMNDSIITANRKQFIDIHGQPMTASYYHHLMGKLRFVLQIEPNHTWFNKAMNDLEQVYQQTIGQ